MDRPELDLGALRAGLPRWSQVDVAAETASTNAELLSRSNAGDRTLLAAEFQSAGRGRFDRVWTSPPRAGITASFLLRPTAPLRRWGWLPLLTGLAVVEAVAELTELRPRLKWPNDVRLDDRKLAGILVQSAEGSVVIGVGANVSTTSAELPEGVAATSLVLAGAEVDRTELLVAIAHRLDARATQWDDCGGDASACGLAEAYRQACETIGQPVRVISADGDLTGVARAVDDDGHLLLERDGQVQTVAAGDVEHLRPASG